jgi:hypothetical protein
MPSLTRESRQRNRNRRRQRTATSVVAQSLHPPPLYTVEPEEKVEIPIIGHNLQVSQFAPVEGGINFGDPANRHEAHSLMYQYRTVDQSLVTHSIYFIGGKPKVYFLYQDDRYPSPPIPEYRLIQNPATNTLSLRLQHLDSRYDSRRGCPSDAQSEPPVGFVAYLGTTQSPLPTSHDHSTE